jgi:PAS domain S-box-containing protein
MMRLNSITVKLIAIIMGAFVITTIGVLVLADIQLKRILDQSQTAVYKEQIDTIIDFLSRTDQRLKKTGLVEAYADDFKQSALKFLRESHYKASSPPIYPFIMDADGTVVMHPHYPSGDESLKKSAVVQHIRGSGKGQFEAEDQGRATWYCYRRFAPWSWVVVYTVPLDIKYGDARIFRNTLMGIMGWVIILVLLLLVFVVRRFTRPIVRLTEAASQMTDGNLGYAIDSRGNDEVGILAHAFVRMRDAIQDQFYYLNKEIEERKLTEKLLQESEAHLSEAQKLAGLGYWEWNVQTGAVDWSEDVYRIFRLNPAEFTPQINSIMKLSPWPEYRKRYEEILQRTIETKEKGSFDQKFLRSDGSIGYFHSTFKGKYDRSGNLASLQGTVIDITERKIRESELQRLRKYLGNIIDSMPSMLVGVDAEGTITIWNREAEKITGRAAKEVRGKPLDTAIPRLSAEMERVRRAIRTRQEQFDPKRIRRENENLFFEDLTIYPLIADGVEGAVIRIDDVTEKVRMEEMMIQSEKMLSVGGLAAGMAHEINNPLAGMIQTARVMANRLVGNDAIPANFKAAEAAGTSMEAIATFMEARGIHRMLDTIIDSGKRVAEIVANMLSFARKSDTQVAIHSLVELLEKTIELAATDYDLKTQYDFKQIEVVRKYDANLPRVPCEGAKIQQVLLNIFRNGAQAMQTKAIDTPRLTIRAYAEADQPMVCLEIEDNGPGMDETTRKRVFEPFFTTKPVGVGTGLGLSVSYFIITENHKGQMSVASTPGKGATFFIRLPIAGST